jgi:hypothetical protein
VVAKDESEATNVARLYARDICNDSNDSDFEISVECAVTSPDFKRGGWDKDCIPYGDRLDLRIGERLPAQTGGINHE